MNHAMALASGQLIAVSGSELNERRRAILSADCLRRLVITAGSDYRDRGNGEALDDLAFAVGATMVSRRLTLVPTRHVLCTP